MSSESTLIESEDTTPESLKELGNIHFAKKEFDVAENYYTKAINKTVGDNAVLYTNRAAAKLEQHNLIGALDDCNRAIEVDPKWFKAYFKKNSVLSKLGRSMKEQMDVWRAAQANCEPTPLLAKSLKEASAAWLKVYKKEPVFDADDLLSRFNLLSNSRERLSTMAHLWNVSTTEERFNHFHYLLTMIKGEGELPEHIQSVNAAMMHPMPLRNYDDLPSSLVAPWCSWFHDQAAEDKTRLFERIWLSLSTEDQTAVIQDLKLFVTNAIRMRDFEDAKAKGIAIAEKNSGDVNVKSLSRDDQDGSDEL